MDKIIDNKVIKLSEKLDEAFYSKDKNKIESNIEGAMEFIPSASNNLSKM